MKNTRVLLSVLWRSFFVQALWNFERLQNIGFVFGIFPIIKNLYPDPEKRKEALLRHINFFNTNPYMVNMIFGMVASMEKDIADGKNVDPGQLNILKNNMAGPLAAIGDTFFWATWRPFSVLVAVSAALFLLKYDNLFNGLIVPALFIFVYNVVALPFRYWSFKVSYHMHEKIVEIIASLEFQFVVDIVKLVSILALAISFIFYFFTYATTFLHMLLFAVVFILSVFFGCFRFSSTLMFFGVIILSIILAYL
jgi:mannose/fructose/N-acetylgalactosamine-specific phosphotransferase system component IID